MRTTHPARYTEREISLGNTWKGFLPKLLFQEHFVQTKYMELQPGSKEGECLKSFYKQGHNENHSLVH